MSVEIGSGLEAPATLGKPTGGRTREPAPARRNARKGSVRRVAVRTHRWLSLVLGLWVAMQCATGTVLIFTDQIDAWLRPGLYHSTSGDAGPTAALQAARQAHPGWAVRNLTVPAVNDGVYGVGMRPSETRSATVYVDPGTGHVNGTHTSDGGFTSNVRRLHETLMQDTVLGLDGEKVVGWLAVAWLAITTTGIGVALSTRVRRRRDLVRVQWRGASYRRWLSVHRTVGLVVVVPLLLIILTGINFAFTDNIKPVVDAVTPGALHNPRQAPALRSTEAGGKPLTAEAALDAARREVPDGQIVNVTLPAAKQRTAPINVRVSVGYDPRRGPRGSGGNAVLLLDAYDGHRLFYGRPSDVSLASQGYYLWAQPLHTGSFGRVPTRVLWEGVATGGLVLAGSGYLMWWRRNRQVTGRKTAHRKTAARASADAKVSPAG